MALITPRPSDYREAIDGEALIEEARRRHQHRLLTTLGIAIVLMIAALVTIAITSGAGGKGQTSPIHPVAGASKGTVADPAAMKGHGDLAFVSRGDLFVIDGANGEVVNVSGADHQASTPLYSPNGRWLTYVTNSGATSWLAEANGSNARRLPGVGSWLATGQLVVSGASTVTTYTLGASGMLHRVASTAEGNGFGEVEPGTTAFTTSSLRVNPPKTSYGIERLETTNSTGGRPTIWYQSAVGFNRRNGMQGRFIGDVTVLPDHAGLLFTLDTDMGVQADGLPLYELRSPGGRPQLLGTVLNGSDTPSYGPDGSFAISAGGNRYAWAAKHVELCRTATASCNELPTSPNVLSLSAVWSPNASTLAFIEATAEPQDAIGQPQIATWYETHHLDLLATGSARPVEVADTRGAAVPVWSADSKSLMFVENDDLFMIAHRGAPPVEIAGPLYPPGHWGGYYGELDWNDLFAWSAT